LIIFLILYEGLKKTNVYEPKTNTKKDIPIFRANIFELDKQINSDDIFKDDGFYLLNIWASWCVPCRKEHSFLMNFSKKKNLKIIGLNYKDKDENARKFLKELGNPYHEVLLDSNGTISIEWGAYGVPETFLIHNRKIIKKIIGPLNENLFLEIKKMIE
jgi:cytochrome c biogenesis protein CcmG/thiol:disulfide interchange protein DsbE